MFFCARTQMLSNNSLNRTLEITKEFGFDGVEISMLNSSFKLRPELLEDYVIKHNRNLLDQLELYVSAVSCHGDYIYKDEIYNIIKKTIPKVRDYGTNILIISGTQKKTFDKNEWELMIKRTKELVIIAENYGVLIAVEFEPGFIVGNTNELLALFKEIPSENLAANLDIGHVFLCDEKPMESIQMLNKKIVHVHIENMYRGVHNHLLPDRGDMDLLSYINALEKIGFKGGAALDLYAYDYEAVAADAVKYLKSLKNS